MNLRDIAAVSGKSGLYRVLKPTRTGVILESLDANKTKLVANANSRVSILKEISVYTTTAEGTVSTLGTNVTTLSNSVGTISTGLATKNTTFVGGTAPTANRAGDIWIDTNSGNELKTWTGSAWTSRRDTTFAKTTDLGTKLNATTSIIQSTVDNKITANAAGLEIFSGSANSGLKFTGTGFFGYKNSVPTFSILSDGTATFAGTLSAATGSFTGAVTATSGVIGGFTLTGGTDFTAKLDVNPRIIFGNKILIGSIDLGGTSGDYGLRIGNPYGTAGASFRINTADDVNRFSADSATRTYAGEVRNALRAAPIRSIGAVVTESSSRRFKENIVSAPKRYYDRILNVDPMFYTYKTDSEEVLPELRGHHRFGMIAEDLEEAGLGYFVALAWAVWPEEKSILDPVLGNPTGLGVRNVGDTFGSKKTGEVRGEVHEKDMTVEIEKIAKLLKEGHLTPEEYSSMKKKIIKESGF